MRLFPEPVLVNTNDDAGGRAPQPVAQCHEAASSDPLLPSVAILGWNWLQSSLAPAMRHPLPVRMPWIDAGPGAASDGGELARLTRILPYAGS
jgi:hypothetical protein